MLFAIMITLTFKNCFKLNSELINVIFLTLVSLIKFLLQCLKRLSIKQYIGFDR